MNDFYVLALANEPFLNEKKYVGLKPCLNIGRLIRHVKYSVIIYLRESESVSQTKAIFSPFHVQWRKKGAGVLTWALGPTPPL